MLALCERMPSGCLNKMTEIKLCLLINHKECSILNIRIVLKPLSHQTAMPRRLYSVLKPCQRAVGSPRNTPKISNVSVIACTQRPCSVPTASLQRPHDVPTASLHRPWRFHSAHTTRSRRAHGVFTAHTQRLRRL